ncbi:OmpA/MotB family protein [Desulfonatronovibrio magnus]|uniref:OmpA/MotB family protein n=1 Tax=Desulfonatronovibrio magnus TaxID=698827 RepID=UPI0018DDC465|nr:OmpA family protein [Desulfonatronovibrio magnus]
MSYDLKSSYFVTEERDYSPETLRSSWAVPWSDLMMVMFILFLVLFIFHARENKVTVPQAFFAQWDGRISHGVQNLDLDPLLVKMRENLPANSSVLDYYRGENGDLIISLFGETFFNKGSTELNDQSINYLEQIARIVSLAQGGIIVSGYADAAENHSNPWEMSAIRAAGIGLAMEKLGNISKEKIVVQGYGVSKPLVPQHLEISSERNRRVEIRILNNQS